jgi:hypothetical protein
MARDFTSPCPNGRAIFKELHRSFMQMSIRTLQTAHKQVREARRTPMRKPAYKHMITKSLPIA